jgi:hypothetical protein
MKQAYIISRGAEEFAAAPAPDLAAGTVRSSRPQSTESRLQRNARLPSPIHPRAAGFLVSCTVGLHQTAGEALGAVL